MRQSRCFCREFTLCVIVSHADSFSLLHTTIYFRAVSDNISTEGNFSKEMVIIYPRTYTHGSIHVNVSAHYLLFTKKNCSLSIAIWTPDNLRFRNLFLLLATILIRRPCFRVTPSSPFLPRSLSLPWLSSGATYFFSPLPWARFT